jgi:hypothetical protein
MSVHAIEQYIFKCDTWDYILFEDETHMARIGKIIEM